jgi:multimeric flavodoxin WrbA
MKVTAFVASARKKHTYHATEKFMTRLQELGDMEYEIVALSEYNLQTCRGCRVCFDKGEEFCPLQDDRNLLINKIMDSDGVLFATPNYSFQVSGFMKVFLDRLGFVFHRPQFFGKAFTSIVAQGIYGGGKIVNYLDFVGNGLGFNAVKGSCVMTIEPVTEKAQAINDKKIDSLSKKFYSQLTNKTCQPSLIKLFLFRMARSSMKIMLDDRSRDYKFYKENGWFESDYYYPVKLSPLKKLSGELFDRRVSHIARTKNRVGIF